jgi:hypothetical protein
MTSPLTPIPQQVHQGLCSVLQADPAPGAFASGLAQFYQSLPMGQSALIATRRAMGFLGQRAGAFLFRRGLADASCCKVVNWPTPPIGG